MYSLTEKSCEARMISFLNMLRAFDGNADVRGLNSPSQELPGHLANTLFVVTSKSWPRVLHKSKESVAVTYQGIWQ